MEILENNYFTIAVNDLLYALAAYKIGNSNHSCLDSQQIVEKLLKHIIVSGDLGRNDYDIKTHN